MIRSFRALFVRGLGRLASERTVLFGSLLALLVLALAEGSAIAFAIGAAPDRDSLAARIRSIGWTQGNAAYALFLAVLIAVLGVNQVYGDVRRGTVFGVLARPVTRGQVFFAGFAASAAFVLLLDSLRSGLLILAASWYDGHFDSFHLLGAMAVLVGEWLLLAAFASLGAVLPPTHAIFVGIGGLVVSSLAFGRQLGAVGRPLAAGLGSLLPLATHQGSTVRAALFGTTRDPWPVIEVIVYRVLWTILLLCLGAYLFARRDLSPQQ